MPEWWPPPMPTLADAHAAWRELFAARLVERGILDAEAAKACAEAGEVDLSVGPAEAADDEVTYWDADE
jgi:hypothetical protein